jgi:hypothetical protein
MFAIKIWIGIGELPGDDGCLNNTTRNTVVLLDYSDSISRQTRDEIESRAMAWVTDSVMEGERVSVFIASAESIDSLQPVFTKCRPPADGNMAISNVRAIRRAFENEFNGPLKKILGAPAASSTKSPLAQVLIDLSLSRFMRTDTTTLLVFSDLLEHNPPRFSLYSCTDPDMVVADFRASRAGMKERPEFRNLRVMLNIIPRGGLDRTTLRCRDSLWMWFFGDNQGTGARLDPSYLPGAPTT